MFRDRPNMNVGASGGNDHCVGDWGFAMQIEADDVFGFGIFKARQDSLRENTGIGFSRTFHRGKR